MRAVLEHHDGHPNDDATVYTKPFGESRGPAAVSWPDDKGFLGKPADTETGLTHVSAREYDPLIGRFLSADPILSAGDHESINGYAYANNTPVTLADPTGLKPAPLFENDSCGTNCHAQEHFTMKPNGHGGFIWVHHTTLTYNYSYPDGSSLTLTVKSSGSHVSYKVKFRTGPSPLPAVKYGSDESFTATPSPSPGMAPDPDYKGTETGPSWGVAGEIALMVCGWVPVVGAGCDVTDLGRSAVERTRSGSALERQASSRSRATRPSCPNSSTTSPTRSSSRTGLPRRSSAKLDRISEHLQMKDLTAAARELKGEVVKRKADGTPWEHVHEVRDAQNGLLKTIADINRKLAHPKTGGAQRDLLVADLGRASRMLDFSEQFAPGGEWSMTVTRNEYVWQLTARAKDGTIPPREVEEIARAVSEGRAGRDLFQPLYTAARAGGPAYESLVAGHLIHPEDPEVSALAVQVLTGHWRVGSKYREQILELQGSPEWDEDDDAFIAAVSGAGEILHDGFDADLLRALLKLAEEGRGQYNDELMQGFAVEAIARALGATHAESMRPPEGVTRATWAEGLLRAARDRLNEAAPRS